MPWAPCWACRSALIWDKSRGDCTEAEAVHLAAYCQGSAHIKLSRSLDYKGNKHTSSCCPRRPTVKVEVPR